MSKWKPVAKKVDVGLHNRLLINLQLAAPWSAYRIVSDRVRHILLAHIDNCINDWEFHPDD